MQFFKRLDHSALPPSFLNQSFFPAANKNTFMLNNLQVPLLKVHVCGDLIDLCVHNCFYYKNEARSVIPVRSQLSPFFMFIKNYTFQV